MSIYNGRRAPNLSQYIDNLNNGTSTAAAEPLGDLDDFSLANIDFFDFEMGDGLRAPVDFEQTLDTKPIGNTEPWEGQSSSDFLSNDFEFSEFNGLTPVLNTSTPGHALHSISPSTPFTTLPDISTSPMTPASGTSLKRKLHDPAVSQEEGARYAAEEDKRKRNTAASARFRVKKKQREQALEKTAKDMADKAQALEKRVHELDMENKWLKEIITEKTGGSDVKAMYAKYLAASGERAHKRTTEPSDL